MDSPAATSVCHVSSGMSATARSNAATLRSKSAPHRELNVDAVSALRALYTGEQPTAGPVFQRSNGAAWGPDRTAWEYALDKAGIKGFRFHDLRHTVASYLAMRGATMREIQEVLGHADVKTTVRYAHLSPGHLWGAVARLEGLTTRAESAHGVHMEGKIEASAV
ncbi:MAG: tyrosine-type recombinase/integrase [Candidatus Rokuibacteriota bacterium]